MLLILKIIGLILAILLGIILICLGLVLFSPIRYKAHINADGTVKSATGRLKFSWIFHLISGFVEYREQKMSWQIRVLGIKVKKKKRGNVKKVSSPKHENEPKEEFKEESKEECAKKNFFQKIKYTILNIYDKIKMFIRLKEQLVEFSQNKTHKMAFKIVKEEFIKLLIILKPKKMYADVEFGFEDPSLTGKVLAGVSVLYPFYPDTICITPDFEHQIFRGEAQMKGRVGVVPLLKICKRLFFDKYVRKTYNDMKKLKSEI